MDNNRQRLSQTGRHSTNSASVKKTNLRLIILVIITLLITYYGKSGLKRKKESQTRDFTCHISAGDSGLELSLVEYGSAGGTTPRSTGLKALPANAELVRIDGDSM